MNNKYIRLSMYVTIVAVLIYNIVQLRAKRIELEQYKKLHPEQPMKVTRPPAVEKKLPKDVIEDDPALRSHWDAINRCKHEGNVPVMGYNYAVICLTSASVTWTQVDSIPF